VKVKIKNFENDGANKLVGFYIEDANGKLFAIDKRVPLQNGKSEEEYVSEAYALCKNEIDEWQSSFANVGKEFNPVTGKIE
jgi:hypothetical protein